MVLGCIAAACLVAAAILAILHVKDDRQSQDTFSRFREAAAQREETTPDPVPQETENSAPGTASPTPEEPGGPSAQPADTPEPTPALAENPYIDSFQANKDMAAWLQIPDTAIDYPVMWTPEDEDYYLRRGFDGSENQNGCLILDTDSCVDPLTTNLIIHGHNMRSGAMFGTLTDYEDEDFYQEHKHIFLYTKDRQRRYEVIAVFRSQVYRKSDTVFKFYQFFQADTQEEFDDFYDNIMKMSIYDTGVTAEFGDHFLTLSTCAYHVEQGRFVVVAKEIDSGELYQPLPEGNDSSSDASGREMPES